MVAAIDDEACIQIMRLFNEDDGRKHLSDEGVDAKTIEQMNLAGISGICNLVASIKAAKYYEMTGRDVIVFPMTDSMQLYGSRIEELRHQLGNYKELDAAKAFARYVQGAMPDNLRELNYQDRKQLLYFKYFSWVELQQRDANDLRKLWEPDFWTETFAQVEQWDQQIEDFNRRVNA
jgi:hypothetical protein